MYEKYNNHWKTKNIILSLNSSYTFILQIIQPGALSVNRSLRHTTWNYKENSDLTRKENDFYNLTKKLSKQTILTLFYQKIKYTIKKAIHFCKWNRLHRQSILSSF